ncbi:hypothetical protein F0562_030369 [Nyssa sinensis]|uniref:Uncharacterized protein n=1 Tax=Nyssa sinensis TaxID=561372 RepID=A0A5J5AZP1_9ASTE|nr:hypothetical protein F0562_030369 [Nyssa sinensis]
MLGVDVMDMFKGISLKFLAFGQLLEDHPDLRGRVVLVQIVNPARSRGKDVQEVQNEIDKVANEVNRKYGIPDLDKALGLDGSAMHRKSVILVSESIGCSPSLSGAIRVNPWNIDAVADAMNLAISMPDAKKQMRHEKHYNNKGLGKAPAQEFLLSRDHVVVLCRHPRLTFGYARDSLELDIILGSRLRC